MKSLYIIIPVYKGSKETRACIDSVISHTKGHQVLIINDASPDAEINHYVASLSQLNPSIHLSTNPANLGFVKTVNLGFDFNKKQDVVILNSDTVVTKNWIEKLQAWAYSDPTAATVTPMSNNATICSYPRSCKQNLLPDNLSPDELNCFFEKAASFQSDELIDIPTGVGFCLYIKREYLEKVGYFNETLFGTGYGEENDFCMRCTQKGARHLVALDTFIFHNEGVSFGEKQKEEQTKSAIKVLNKLYPAYDMTIQHFLETDPLITIRRWVDFLRFSKIKKNGVLFVSHGKGGGVQEHIRDLSSLIESQNCRPFLLTPLKNRGVSLVSVSSGEEFCIEIDSKKWLEKLVIFLKHFNICHLHYHHLMDYHEDVYRLPETIGLTYDFTLHDFYMFCPNISGYVDIKDYYCGFDAKISCLSCSYTNQESAFSYHPHKNNIQLFQEKNHFFLKSARKIISPSQSTKEIYNRYYPDLPIEVLPHPERYAFKFKTKNKHQEKALDLSSTTPSNNNITLNVALLGGLSPKKGRRVFERCLYLSRKKKLPIRWILVGYADHSEFTMKKDLVITGKYDKEKLSELFSRHCIQIVVLPAKWPETYSYTLSECFALECPVIVPSIGAFKERVQERGGVIVLPSPITAESIIEQIENLIAQPKLLQDLKKKIVPFMGTDFNEYVHKVYNPLTFAKPCNKNFEDCSEPGRTVSGELEDKEIVMLYEQLIQQSLKKQLIHNFRRTKLEFSLTQNHANNLETHTDILENHIGNLKSDTEILENHIGSLEYTLEIKREKEKLTQDHVRNLSAENQFSKEHMNILQNEIQALTQRITTVKGVALSIKYLVQRMVISIFRTKGSRQHPLS